MVVAGQGFKMAMQGLDGGRINIGTCSIGAAQRAFEIAREHVQVVTLTTFFCLEFDCGSVLIEHRLPSL